MSVYEPTVAPTDSPPRLRGWLSHQLRQIADTLTEPEVTRIHLAELNAAPSRITDGDIVRADGTNWNPGSGAGIYARISGAWIKL